MNNNKINLNNNLYHTFTQENDENWQLSNTRKLQNKILLISLDQH